MFVFQLAGRSTSNQQVHQQPGSNPPCLDLDRTGISLDRFQEHEIVKLDRSEAVEENA
jgi:hypothetical protein